MIGFENLRARLLDHLRYLVRNGEITERALAFKAGISQPHMHNLLKGIRSLNTATSDQLLSHLGLTVTDLMDADELRRALFLQVQKNEMPVDVPVLLDRLGPGLPWPERLSPFERVAVPFLSVSRMQDPVVARLGEDAEMVPTVVAGDLVLLDRSPRASRSTDPEALFAVEWNGDVALRWVRRGCRRWYLVSVRSRDTPHHWKAIEPGDDASPIRARAISLRSIYPTEFVYDPLLPPRGTPPGPVRR